MNEQLLSQKLGYSFKNAAFLKLALTHRSVSPQNNERLEFLGDSILNFIVASELYTQYPQAKEGRLSRHRSGLVKKDMLAEMANELEINSFLNLGSGEMRTGGFQRESILANTLEALVGAIYLDGGIDACWECIKKWYGPRLLILAASGADKDPKTKLQEILQRKQLNLPQYTVLSTTGEAHSQIFHVSCKTELFVEPAEGAGTTRKKAEQQAAANIIDRLAKINAGWTK
ncbi:MAG: ribonuclease III [Gammaproteobacteria bacterium]|nr:ribonuclease III [Gammaproteobacteria bacterium]